MRRAAGALALVVVVAGCGTGESVAVPGVVSTEIPETVTTVDRTFTPVARVDVAAPVDAPVTSRSVPMPPVSSTSTVVTSTTVPFAGRAARDVVPAPVIADVRGWPAFDLDLQTILTGGSDAVSAAVMYDGELVHEVALGHRTVAGAPVAKGDRFRVASISKVITSITVLRLVQA
jgi:D-alanyl-D-alanine carboxypeptidase